MAGDVISTEDDTLPGEALLRPVMSGGKRLHAPIPLEESRALTALQLAKLPEHLRSLAPGRRYEVRIGDKLRRLADSTQHGS